jgi:diguanylate cyclase (GGDEF)-like protein/PAS domain S-box-containing protein
MAMKTMQDAVRRKQVELLYTQSRAALLTALGVALFIGIYFWSVADRLHLLTWLGMISFMSLVRLVLYDRFRRIQLKSFNRNFWLRWHILLTFISGVVWGLLGLIYDPGWPVAHQVVLIVVLSGMGIGSFMAYSAVLEVFVVYLIPLLLPLMVSFFADGDQATTFLGGLLFLFATGILLLAQRFHLTVIDSIHLSLSHQFLQQEVHSGTRRLLMTEQALQNSEEKFDQVLESSLDGFWDWDLISGQFYLSPRWKEQLGYTDDELPNTFDTWESRLHPDEREEVMRKLQAYLNNPWGSWEEEFRLRHKNGDYRWIQARAKPVLGDNDKVVRLTGVHTDISERVIAEGQVNYLAYHDSLTELPNRLLFNDRVDHAIARAKRADKCLGILFFDLDHFKHINDSLGHPAGDRVLTQVARRLRKVVRKEDTLARLGGDEFAVLIENVERTQGLAVVAEKLLGRFGAPFKEEEHEFYLNASIGISVYPRDGESPAALLKNADAAMYKAKNSGRGSYQFYTEELTNNAYQHFTLEAGLRQALINDQFELHYQAKISLQSGRLVGAEALIRWRHPEMGYIGPDAFIPVAEESGLIRELGEWVLVNACIDAREWCGREIDFGHVAVNLSGVQLQHETFVVSVRRVLQETGLDARYLELEVTENFLMRDAEASARYLNDLRQLGLSIAIDDFGTGYSSLAHLTRFPVNKLKIDRSFVTNARQDEHNREISRTIISLGHALDMLVVAEGIEEAEQLEFLRQAGCDEGQGYFISKPLPKEAFINFIESYEAVPQCKVAVDKG